ncbi:translation initiation factor IF-2 N-terminal domain-containing protein [Pseudonocardia parietis]|uniref:Ribonuclease E n=1 Tax=Pseudonocardia parietis TaxID=570936 RepID=A0ABS4VRU0_9PSEU|nr:translation initiation factor IF-2 N-terminal domain-containing protein [Pseudonocardia parietis]MBP2366645.1 ribonuclease E [Pseudonocardia parietis]
MSVNDAPAGDTGGLSGEPAPHSDLPEKMRVHALAKLLGRASRDVLGALATLGQDVRSVQSNITRATAEQVVAALAPVTTGAGSQAAPSGEPEPETPAQEPPAQESPAQEPPAQESPAQEPPARETRRGRGTAGHDPFAGNTTAPAAAGAPAETPSAGLTPVFAVPMFQAPTTPATPVTPAAPATGPGDSDGDGDGEETAESGGGRRGRKSRRRKPATEQSAADQVTTGQSTTGQSTTGQSGTGQSGTGQSGTEQSAAGQSAADRPATDQPVTGQRAAEQSSTDRSFTDRSSTEQSSTEQSSPDSEDDADDDEGNRRRRRRGRRGRGRGKGGDEQGDSDTDSDSDSESDSDDEDSDDRSDGDSSQDEADGDSDGGGDEQSSGGSRRRRRRRRRGGTEVEDRSEDDPPNTVTKVREVREARTESAGDGVQSVRGSTRLEAKRQRRRDGRDAGRRRPPILSESEFLARRESVDRQMVIRQLADRTEIGVLEDDVLVEHFITGGNSGSSMVGNIYLGRVQNVLPSMEAAFVDIGRGRNAVLYAGEVNWDAAGLNGKARKIEQALSSGDQVLVQVTKDPVGHKGARLTTQISLAGRFLVYVPAGGAAGISRKLPDTERKRLKEMLKEIVPSEAGVIIRTASEGVSHESLERDVRRLQAQWAVVKEKSEKTGPGAPKAPTLLYEEPDMLVKVVRDQFNEDFTKLTVSGADAWDTVFGYVQHVAPELADRMHRHTGPSDVFTDNRIDEQLLKALDRKVWLPSGGTLVIDRTEAMTVVDVNTGKFTGSGGNLEETVTRNNLEAAEEIVRQLRLRDIGGIIVVDFIDMVLEANRDLVLRRLTECLARDRTRHQVAEVTSLGLVQMTRKRVGGGLLEHFSTPCEHCRGRGVIVSTETAADHSHGGGRGNGGGNANDNGAGDGGGRRRRRRGGGGNGDGDTGPNDGPDAGGPEHNGSERNGHADRAVDTSSAAAGVAAVAAGRAVKGDDGAVAGSEVPATGGPATESPASAGTEDTRPAATEGASPARTDETVPATADSTVVDAAPAPEPSRDPDDGTAVAEPVGRLTGTAAPHTGRAPAEPTTAGSLEPAVADTAGAAPVAGDATVVGSTAVDSAGTAPGTPADEAPAPRRRRVSRSAGAPRTSAEPVVITTPAQGEDTPAPAPEGADTPAVPAQPEPAAVVSQPRRRRRSASRPAGPPQDGG